VLGTQSPEPSASEGEAITNPREIKRKDTTRETAVNRKELNDDGLASEGLLSFTDPFTRKGVGYNLKKAAPGKMEGGVANRNEKKQHNLVARGKEAMDSKEASGQKHQRRFQVKGMGKTQKYRGLLISLGRYGGADCYRGVD